jgi:hypothetical protein
MSIFILLIFALMLGAFGLDLGGVMPEMELDEFGSENNKPSNEKAQGLASKGRALISDMCWKNGTGLKRLL